MSGSEKIRVGRLYQNEKNLSEDKEAWEIISKFNENQNQSLIELFEDKKGKLKIKTYLYKSNFLNITKEKNKRIQQVANSIIAKIFRMNALHYKLSKENDIKLWMIAEMASFFLKIPKEIQIHFCRNATRQTFDQKKQIEMIEEGIKVNFYTKYLKSGEKTVSNGVITNDLKNIPKDQTSRSIDIEIHSKDELKGITAYGFLKYSNPIGSLTTSLQPGESYSFINESKKYCNKNNDKSFFFIQVDGEAGEKEINEMNKHIDKYKNRIFVGNTEDVINWLNSLIT
jgi:hypothetical protein